MARAIEPCGRRLKRCANNPRRLADCKGKPGDPCADACFGRALTGDPLDKCGGLFAPLCKIGTEFAVQFTGDIVSVFHLQRTLSASSADGNSITTFNASGVLRIEAHPTQPGICVAVWRDVSGSANMSGHLAAVGNGVYNFPAGQPPFQQQAVSRQFTEANAQNFPWYKATAYNEPCPQPPNIIPGPNVFSLASLCGYAYLRPFAFQGMQAATINDMFQEWQFSWPTEWIQAYQNMEIFIKQFYVDPALYHPQWMTENCEGIFQTGSPPFNFQYVQWQNSQGCMAASVDIRAGRLITDPGFTEGQSETVWRGTLQVSTATPCPATGPGPTPPAVPGGGSGGTLLPGGGDSNGSAIAGLMGRDPLLKPGCCG